MIKGRHTSLITGDAMAHATKFLLNLGHLFQKRKKSLVITELFGKNIRRNAAGPLSSMASPCMLKSANIQTKKEQGKRQSWKNK
jgi:hypothetical protein